MASLAMLSSVSTNSPLIWCGSMPSLVSMRGLPFSSSFSTVQTLCKLAIYVYAHCAAAVST